MKWFMVLQLIFALSFSHSYGKEQTEAQVCLECSSPENKSKLQPLPVESCEKKALLFDPKYKTYFEKKNVDAVTSQNEFVESLLSCYYGFGKGVYLSVRDLLRIIPMIIDGSIALAKGAYKGTKKIIQDPEWAGSALKSIGHSIGEGASNIKDSVTKTWKEASAKTRNAYVTAGIGGAVSAMTAEMLDKSPAALLNRAFRKLGQSTYQFLSREWDAFACMTTHAQAEIACTVATYVVTSAATGQLIWGNLAQSSKILAGLDIVKKKMLRTPVIGTFMMREFKPLSSEAVDKMKDVVWKTDGRLRLEGASVEVAAVDGKIFARGVDPQTRKLTVYQVTGKNEVEIAARLQKAEKAAVQGGRAVSASSEGDFFSPTNGQIARQMDDYVLGTNREVKVDISNYHVKKISQLFEKSPATADEYGELLKSLHKMDLDLEKQFGKKIPKDKAEMVSEVRNLLKEVNASLARSEPNEVLNLRNLKNLVDETVETGELRGVQVYRNAIAGLNEAGGPSKFDSFFSNLGYNKIVSEELQKKVRQCLLASGAK